MAPREFTTDFSEESFGCRIYWRWLPFASSTGGKGVRAGAVEPSLPKKLEEILTELVSHSQRRDLLQPKLAKQLAQKPLVTQDNEDSEAGSKQTHLADCKGHSLQMVKLFENLNLENQLDIGEARIASTARRASTLCGCFPTPG